MMLPLLLWRDPVAAPTSAPILWSLGYVGILASALAFWLWNRGVVRLGPGRAGPYLYLMPVYDSIFSVLFLGERPQLFQYIGGMMVIAGLWLAQSQVRTRGPSQSPLRLEPLDHSAKPGSARAST